MRDLPLICIVALLFIIGLTCCSKSIEPIYTAPVCDCRRSEEDADHKCLGRYVCSASTPCVGANGLNDKCVPADTD